MVIGEEAIKGQGKPQGIRLYRKTQKLYYNPFDRNVTYKDLRKQQRLRFVMVQRISQRISIQTCQAKKAQSQDRVLSLVS